MHLQKKRFFNSPKLTKYQILIKFSVLKALKDEISFKKHFLQNFEDYMFLFLLFVFNCFVLIDPFTDFVNLTPLMKLLLNDFTSFKDNSREN